MKEATHSSKSTHKKGELIDYKFLRTGGVFTGRILYLDEEKIKIGSPPPSGVDTAVAVKLNIKRRKHKNRGSWYWLDEIKIL